MSNQMKDRTIYIFYSRTQLRFKQQTEGSRFAPQYAIINGKKKQYTEKRYNKISPFSDAILLYNGSEKDVKFI